MCRIVYLSRKAIVMKPSNTSETIQLKAKKKPTAENCIMHDGSVVTPRVGHSVDIGSVAD